MLFYSTIKTPRLSYIVNLIGSEIFDHTIELTDDEIYFKRFNGPKINYSKDHFDAASFYLYPHELLFESGIREQKVVVFDSIAGHSFFRTNGDFPFDIFAASFYLVSRYEEWLPFQPDRYGRFPYESSIAYKQNFLQLPLVNNWIFKFKHALKEKFPSIVLRVNAFKFIPSYDIDMAYSYKFKGIKRNLGGFIRDLIYGKWSNLSDRWNVLFRNKKDPFDAYEWLDSLHLYCRTRAYYFFLVSRKSKGFDKNISPGSEAMKSLINYHANGYTVGLHPSWKSGDDKTELAVECDFLRQLTGKPVEYSRQHYIRMSLPNTYRRLIEAGIKKDFSMGYGGKNGFRASIASSFFWYDLELEKQTDLLIFPFCFMDANAFYYQKLNPVSAFNELMDLYFKIKRVNGLMITIWHNEMLGTDRKFKGWREVYEIFLKDQIFWDM